MLRLAPILIFFCVVPRAFADYAWIPKYEHFHIRGGIDIYSSTQNFADDSFLDAPRVSGQTISFDDVMFWLRPEYGIAQDWSIGMFLGFSRPSATSDGTGAVLASGSGIMDVWMNAKWQLSEKPLLTLEGYFKLPLGTATPTTTDEIVIGEGNLDAGLKLHIGHQEGNFYFSGAPGFLGRFGGYSSAITAEAAVQMFIYRAYAKIFVNSMFSLSSQALAPSTVAGGQTLSGTAGSYARLAASPTNIIAGGAIGVLITKNFRGEAGLSKVVWGQRTPNYISFTINLLSTWDLSTPDYRPKVKEVPFDNPPSDF